MAEGIPSTKINRRSFLTASLRSVVDRAFDDDLGKAKILLNDFAVSEVEGFEDIYSGEKKGICLSEFQLPAYVRRSFGKPVV
jgi:hypothetical protein